MKKTVNWKWNDENNYDYYYDNNYDYYKYELYLRKKVNSKWIREIHSALKVESQKNKSIQAEFAQIKVNS